MAKFITPKFKELIRFVVVGTIMTLVNFALLAFFKEIIGMNYLIANVVSYTISVVLSYFVNVVFTFKQKITQVKSEINKLIKYCLMKLIFLGLDSICLYIMVDKLKVNLYISKLLLTIIFTLGSYGIGRIIVMGKRNEINRL